MVHVIWPKLGILEGWIQLPSRQVTRSGNASLFLPLWYKITLSLNFVYLYSFLCRFLRSAMHPQLRSWAITPAMTFFPVSFHRIPTRRRPCWILSRRWAGTTSLHWLLKGTTGKAAWKRSCRSPERWVRWLFQDWLDALMN